MAKGLFSSLVSQSSEMSALMRESNKKTSLTDAESEKFLNKRTRNNSSICSSTQEDNEKLIENVGPIKIKLVKKSQKINLFIFLRTRMISLLKKKRAALLHGPFISLFSQLVWVIWARWFCSLCLLLSKRC